jgi:hypothetical protein
MRCEWRRYSRACPPGSGYCEEQGVNIERWTEWHLWGLLLWRRREVVRELMPHEWISSATLGGER